MKILYYKINCCLLVSLCFHHLSYSQNPDAGWNILKPWGLILPQANQWQISEQIGDFEDSLLIIIAEKVLLDSSKIDSTDFLMIFLARQDEKMDLWSHAWRVNDYLEETFETSIDTMISLGIRDSRANTDTSLLWQISLVENDTLYT